MNADYLSHKRATSVSLLGLVIQLVLGLCVVIYATYAEDHAGFTAGLSIVLGVPAWLVLAIVFDAHRRERIEDMEARSLDAGAGASSVFSDSTQELRVAARRLNLLHRFFVPGASLLIALGYIGFGLTRFWSGRRLISIDHFHTQSDHGWPIGIGVGVGVVAFMLARYVSGMAMQKVWTNLRAGAAASVGSALVGLSLAGVHLIDIPGPSAPARYLQVALPAFMVGLGIEILLNLLIGIYRPRKAGEAPRPGFDSRALGFIAAPDRVARSIGEALNYQFGFDVSSSWFYRLLSRWATALAGVGVLVMWLLTSLTIVEPHQRGVMLRFGRVVDEDVGPGLHLKAPWPIDRVLVPEVGLRDAATGIYHRAYRTATGVRELSIGSSAPNETGAILWTNDHTAKEAYMLVQPPTSEQGSGAGKDLSLVAVEIPIHFVVRDPLRFETLGPPEQRDEMLRAVAQREASLYFSSLPEDRVLSSGRNAIAGELRSRVERAFEGMNRGPDGTPRGAGVDVLFVGISGVHPPKDVAPSFEFVIQAEQKQQALVESAQAEAIATLTRVVGDVSRANDIVRELDVLETLKSERSKGAASEDLDRRIGEQEARVESLMEQASGTAGATILSAKAERWARHMGARSRATRHAGELASYAASPEIQRASLYLDTLRGALSGTRLYVLPGGAPLHLRLDLMDRDTGLDTFKPNPDEDNTASK